MWRLSLRPFGPARLDGGISLPSQTESSFQRYSIWLSIWVEGKAEVGCREAGMLSWPLDSRSEDSNVTAVWHLVSGSKVLAAPLGWGGHSCRAPGLRSVSPTEHESRWGSASESPSQPFLVGKLPSWNDPGACLWAPQLLNYRHTVPLLHP